MEMLEFFIKNSLKFVPKGPTSVDQDLQRHMVPLGSNELTHWGLGKISDFLEMIQTYLQP